MKNKLYLGLFVMILSILMSFQNGMKVKAYEGETVFDYAELLSEEEKNQLRKYSEKYKEDNISFVFLTTLNAEGKTTMTYSDEFYDTHLFDEDGVLFVIDMDNREIYINTLGRCIDWLEMDLDYILDAAYTYAGNGEYFKCMSEMSKRCDAIIQECLQDVSTQTIGNPQMQGNQESQMYSDLTYYMSQYIGTILVISVVITVVVIFFVISFHGSSNSKTSASYYMGSHFAVKKKDVVFLGCRDEVVPGYYRQEEHNSVPRGGGPRSSGFGGGFPSSGSRMSGSRTRSTSRHVSSRGVSHGGRGRKF